MRNAIDKVLKRDNRRWSCSKLIQLHFLRRVGYRQKSVHQGPNFLREWRWKLLPLEGVCSSWGLSLSWVLPRSAKILHFEEQAAVLQYTRIVLRIRIDTGSCHWRPGQMIWCLEWHDSAQITGLQWPPFTRRWIYGTSMETIGNLMLTPSECWLQWTFALARVFFGWSNMMCCCGLPKHADTESSESSVLFKTCPSGISSDVIWVWDLSESMTVEQGEKHMLTG